MTPAKADSILRDVILAGRLRLFQPFTDSTHFRLLYSAPEGFPDLTLVISGDLRRCFRERGPPLSCEVELDSLEALTARFGERRDALIWVATELASELQAHAATEAVWAEERRAAAVREFERISSTVNRVAVPAGTASTATFNLTLGSSGELRVKVAYDRSERTQVFLRECGCTWEGSQKCWVATSKDSARVLEFIRIWAKEEQRRLEGPTTSRPGTQPGAQGPAHPRTPSSPTDSHVAAQRTERAAPADGRVQAAVRHRLAAAALAVAVDRRRLAAAALDAAREAHRAANRAAGGGQTALQGKTSEAVAAARDALRDANIELHHATRIERAAAVDAAFFADQPSSSRSHS